MASTRPQSISDLVTAGDKAAGAETLPARMVRSLVIMAVFAVATGLAAQVRVPMVGTEVPLTLQTFAVMVTGLLLSPSLAFGAMSLYLALGIWQVFPFAGSAGLLGATGGYLFGFLLAAPVISLLVSFNRRSAVRQFGAALVGSMIIFVVGVAWLAVSRGGDFGLAIKSGLLPFIPEALLKLGLAVGFVQAGQRLMGGGHRDSISRNGF